MSTGSDELFTAQSDFSLNQILGYQDVNEAKSGRNRLEVAFTDQHAWDRDSNDATWAGNHADPGSGPNYNLGAHEGNIGQHDGAGQTVYWGDGDNIQYASSQMSVSALKGATLVISGTTAITALDPAVPNTINIETVAFSAMRFYMVAITASQWVGVAGVQGMYAIGSVANASDATNLLCLWRTGGASTISVAYKVYRIDES